MRREIRVFAIQKSNVSYTTSLTLDSGLSILVVSANSEPIRHTLTNGKSMIKEDAQDHICVDGWYGQIQFSSCRMQTKMEIYMTLSERHIL